MRQTALLIVDLGQSRSHHASPTGMMMPTAMAIAPITTRPISQKFSTKGAHHAEL